MNAKSMFLLTVTIAISNQYQAGQQKSYFPWPGQFNYYINDPILDDKDAVDDIDGYFPAYRTYYVPKRPYFKSINRKQQPQLGFQVLPQHLPADYYEGGNLNLFRSFQSPSSVNEIDTELRTKDVGKKAQLRNKNKSSFSWLLPDALRRPNDDRQRFFFNYVTTVGSGYTNPFMKTIYYIATSTATSCQFVTCIPKSLFDDGLGTVPNCRRRKRNGDIASEVDVGHLVPSPTEKIETTRIPEKIVLQENLATGVMPHLASSQRETGDGNNLSNEISRRKRLFYNFFIYSTTITSYSITALTTTVTLSNIAGNKQLSCRPSNIAICQ